MMRFHLETMVKQEIMPRQETILQDQTTLTTHASAQGNGTQFVDWMAAPTLVLVSSTVME